MSRALCCWVTGGLGLALLFACGQDAGEETEPSSVKAGSQESASRPVDPPFSVRGDLSGLFVQWFDKDGAHAAETRSEIPAAHRDRVRLESLRVAPAERLDPEHVYIADVRVETGGSYPVQIVARATYDRWVREAVEAGRPPVTVTLYGTSWCPACRGAARFLEEQNVPFVQKDIEQDSAAAQAVAALRRGAGIEGASIPVIDVGGTVLAGFSQPRLQRALKEARLLP